LEDPGIDRWIVMYRRESVDWMHVAHDKDQWWAVEYTVMNLRGP